MWRDKRRRNRRKWWSAKVRRERQTDKQEERKWLRRQIKDKKTARVRDRVNYADWADGRPTVTVTIGADSGSGVLPSTAVSCLTHAHTYTPCKIVRYSELIPLILAHSTTSTQHKPPLNAGLRPALIYQHTHTDSCLQPLSAPLAYFPYSWSKNSSLSKSSR